MQAQVCAVTTSNSLTDTHFIKLQTSTKRDPELQTLMMYVNKGWPDHKVDIPDIIKPYWGYKDDLAINYDLVWRGNRVVIPKDLRKEMLKNVHVGHLGIDKCKLRIRETMFWPNINTQLEDYIKSCQPCLYNKNENRRETMIPHEIPSIPWSKVGTDTFHFNNEIYLIVVDYYSKYIEVSKVCSLMSCEIIQHLKNIVSRYEIPETVVSDNGPEYSSHLFKEFSNSWNFNHVTSSPRYPQSNGQAERSIQTVKNIMRKTKHEGSDFRLGLLEYLNTPISTSLRLFTNRNVE